LLFRSRRRRSMEKCTVPIAASILLVLLFMLGCAGSGRHLQSISVNATGMTQIQLTATGTFTVSPTSVAPLPVAWYVPVTIDPPGGPIAYTLSSEPYSTPCVNGMPGIVAIAPRNPNAPATGTIPEQVWRDLVVSHTTTSEGGFIASSPQPIACP
jgi:hypothetical protein